MDPCGTPCAVGHWGQALGRAGTETGRRSSSGLCSRKYRNTRYVPDMFHQICDRNAEGFQAKNGHPSPWRGMRAQLCPEEPGVMGTERRVQDLPDAKGNNQQPTGTRPSRRAQRARCMALHAQNPAGAQQGEGRSCSTSSLWRLTRVFWCELGPLFCAPVMPWACCHRALERSGFQSASFLEAPSAFPASSPAYGAY